MQAGGGQGWVSQVVDAPENFVWGLGLPQRPGACGSLGKQGVGPREDPWAIQVCCGVHHVIVPVLEDCTPDLRRGSLAVRRWGGGGLRRGCGGRWY